MCDSLHQFYHYNKKNILNSNMILLIFYRRTKFFNLKKEKERNDLNKPKELRDLF
jgi:hypothetical protein